MTRAQRYLLALCCLFISIQVAQAQLPETAYSGYLNRGRLGFVPKHEKLQQAGLVTKQQPALAQPLVNTLDAPVPPPAVTDPIGKAANNPFAKPISALVAESGSIAAADYIEPLPHQPLSPVAQFDSAASSCQCDSCSAPSFASGCSSCSGCASRCGVPVPCSSHSPCYRPRYWISGEFLLWWTRGANPPALVTTSPGGTDQDLAGVLGEAETTTIFGDDNIHDGPRNGGRFTFGTWLTPQRSTGLEVRYTSIETDTEEFDAGQEFDVLGRPFFNTQLTENDARLINFDALVSGDLSIQATSDFDALEITMLRCIGNQPGISNFLFGYRRMSLDESIRIDESTTSLAAPTLNAATVLFDQFTVENTFDGGQIGVHYVTQLNNPCWTFDFLGKASLGNTRSRVRIEGERTTTIGTDVSTVEGGLLALSSNIGSSAESEFSAVFEIGMNLRRSFQNGLHLKFGYTFIHWGDVARAVDQIDTTINPTQIPPDTLAGPARPRLDFQRGSFWAQGLNLGLEYQF